MPEAAANPFTSIHGSFTDGTSVPVRLCHPTALPRLSLWQRGKKAIGPSALMSAAFKREGS